MAKRLNFRVDEVRDGEQPETIARFALKFDIGEYLDMVARYGSDESVFIAYERGVEFDRRRGSNGFNMATLYQRTEDML